MLRRVLPRQGSCPRLVASAHLGLAPAWLPPPLALDTAHTTHACAHAPVQRTCAYVPVRHSPPAPLQDHSLAGKSAEIAEALVLQGTPLEAATLRVRPGLE